MSSFNVPPYLIDPGELPAPLMTSEPGSFAHNTFKVRIPRIIDDIVALNAFPRTIQAAMHSLRNEITDGTIRGLEEDAPDTAFWYAVSEDWLGKTWFQVPWYWAEAYFYRRVLEAIGYFQPGSWLGVDPYIHQKQSELMPGAATNTLARVLDRLPDNSAGRFEALLHASLWGNRTDLSYNVASTIGSARHIDEERDNLLVDDGPWVWDRLSSRICQRVAIITDNAGTELLMDLALADFMLAINLVESVSLQVKEQPFFVSDAMQQDVHASVEAIRILQGTPQALGNRLRKYMSSGRLVLHSHWFYTTCLFYFQLPEDLRNELSTYDLVILKGDANYRRLLGDAHWPPTMSFAGATVYFPSSLVSLRTLKAELIVGLPEGKAEQLSAIEPDWRVNGRRGVIQAR